MKILKNGAVLLMLLCLILSLCACGQETPAEESQSTNPSVDTTPSETPSEPADDGKMTYTVTVVDQDGNPIPGAMVQLCMETCYPGVANDQGVATFHVVAADYKVSFLKLPSGFTYSTEEQDFYFTEGSTDLTITLQAE